MGHGHGARGRASAPGRLGHPNPPRPPCAAYRPPRQRAHFLALRHKLKAFEDAAHRELEVERVKVEICDIPKGWHAATYVRPLAPS